MTFRDQAVIDVANQYAEQGETVNIESKDGADILWDILAIINEGEGPEYQGADAPGTDGMLRVMVRDVKTISDGYKIYRTDEDGDEEIWRVLGKAKKTIDGVEWMVGISKYTGE